MSTSISLVRHGVTDWNYAGRVQGRSDIPLAPLLPDCPLRGAALEPVIWKPTAVESAWVDDRLVGWLSWRPAMSTSDPC